MTMNPEDIQIWGDGEGSVILAGPLDIVSITWITGAQIDVIFSGPTTLTGAQAGHTLIVTDATHKVNIGRFRILEADPANDRLRIKNTARISSTSTYDEASSPAVASVEDGGANRVGIPDEKAALGFFDDEYPSAGQLNDILYDVTRWNKYLAQGGAIVHYDTLAEWKAVSGRSEPGSSFVKGLGMFRFDPDADETPDDETVIAPDDGLGRGYLELAHPDFFWAQLANAIGEDPSGLYDLLHP